MAAIATAIVVSFSNSSSPLFLSKLTSRIHFASFPKRFHHSTRKLMSHSQPRASTLGLTHPTNIETPKVIFHLQLCMPMFLFMLHLPLP
jgi:leucyl aminopeptidase